MQAESVSGYDTLAAHFPSGLTDPTRVIAPTAEAADGRTCDHRHARRGVRRTRQANRANGLSQWSVVLDAEPASEECLQNH